MKSVALAAMLAAMTVSPEAEIRQMRAQSNAAIAAHDVAGMRAVFAPGYTVLPGSSGLPSGLDAFDARIGATFADPTFVDYVRKPTRVVVAASGKRAAESGAWTGRWRKADGELRLTGVYQAMWVPTPGGWRLLNESFVTLNCTGSAACRELD